jgi:hypothetical protein
MGNPPVSQDRKNGFLLRSLLLLNTSYCPS